LRAVCWDGEHPEDPGKWSEKPVQWGGISNSAQPYYYSFVANNQVAYLRVADMKPRENYELIKGYKVAGLKEMLEQYYKEQKQEIPADLDYEMYGDNYFGRNDDAEFVKVKSELYFRENIWSATESL